jgi:hypothetical protein
MKRLLVLAMILLILAGKSQAGLGWTLAECIQHYGKPLTTPESDNQTWYGFSAKEYLILVWINGGEVSRVAYTKPTLSIGEVQALLSTNAPDAVWDDQPTKDEANNQFWWKGRRNGVLAYRAVETSAMGQAALAIWTKDDDDARDAANKRNSKDM